MTGYLHHSSWSGGHDQTDPRLCADADADHMTGELGRRQRPWSDARGLHAETFCPCLPVLGLSAGRPKARCRAARLRLISALLDDDIRHFVNPKSAVFDNKIARFSYLRRAAASTITHSAPDSNSGFEFSEESCDVNVSRCAQILRIVESSVSACGLRESEVTRR